MNVTTIAITVLLAQATPPASAPPEPAAKPVSEAGTTARRDQIVCRQEKVLGSLIPRKVCLTLEQQEDRQQQSRRALDRLQSQFGTCPTPSCR